MATSAAYRDFILEQLSGLEEIGCRAMMGEYILYYRSRIAAYICDDRLLVKPVPSARKLMPDTVYEPPYDGARDMLRVDDVDNRAFLENLFQAMYDELDKPKRKKK